PCSLQATPQVPMAVSKTQWLMTSWSFSMLEDVGSSAPLATRIVLGSPAALGALIPEIGLDRPFEGDQQRVPEAVLGLAGGHPDPALADAVFLDVVFLDALEADADIARQHVGIIIGAVRIVGETVGRRVGHG